MGIEDASPVAFLDISDAAREKEDQLHHLLQLHLTVHVPEQNQRSSVDQTKPVKSRKESQQLSWSSENNFGHSRKLFEIQRRAVCSLSRP